MKFTKDIKDFSYGDLFSVEEWIECVKNGFFTDDDGNGHFVKDGMMTEGFGDDVCDIEECECLFNKGKITHVLWFNK